MVPSWLVWVAVGGAVSLLALVLLGFLLWLGSAALMRRIDSKNVRKVTVKQARKVLSDRGLDGFDLDCELHRLGLS